MIVTGLPFLISDILCMHILTLKTALADILAAHK